MNMNPMILMQIQQKINNFKNEHPRVIPFFLALKDSSIQAGTIVDMKVTTPEGKEMQCNIKVTDNDIELFNLLMEMKNNNA